MSDKIVFDQMSFDFSGFEYSFKFKTDMYFKDTSSESNINITDNKIAIRELLVSEFRLELTEAMIPNLRMNECEKIIQINKKPKNRSNKKYLNQILKEKLLLSLKTESFKWELLYPNLLYSPLYRSPDTSFIRFRVTRKGIFCDLDGDLLWRLPFNPFCKTTREIKRSIKKIKARIENDIIIKVENIKREYE